VRVSPVSTFFAVIEAPGITAPEESLTPSRMVPVGSWDIAGFAIIRKREKAGTITRIVFDA